MFGFLCRLGLHRWRYKPEDAVIISRGGQGGEQASGAYGGYAASGKSPTAHPVSTDMLEMLKTPEAVFIKRECLRCGIKQEKRFSEDAQGNKTVISGWEKTA
jgi:hypothetical protein